MKLSIWKRLFWSSDRLEKFITDQSSLQNQLNELNIRFNNLNNEYNEVSGRKKQLEETNTQLKIEKDDISNKYYQLIGEQKQILNENTKLNEQIKEKIIRFEDIKNKEGTLNTENTRLKSEIDNLKKQLEETNNNIYNRLNPLDEINKLYFGKAANKGKGNLGEKFLEMTFTNDLPPEMWRKGLSVNSNNDKEKQFVEFAFKLKQKDSDLWIPVDSKVIEPEYQQDNTMIIDKKYLGKVIDQAKNVSKYLNKENTTPYGILVIQSEEIYHEIYIKWRKELIECVDNYKVLIVPRSLCMQICYFLQILNTYTETMKSYTKIVDLVNKAVKQCDEWAKQEFKIYDEFNTLYKTRHKKLRVAIGNLRDECNRNGYIDTTFYEPKKISLEHEEQDNVD